MNIRNRITELRYVDMTMARWEQYTGGKAEVTGVTMTTRARGKRNA